MEELQRQKLNRNNFAYQMKHTSAWFCLPKKLASAYYYVTYNPEYFGKIMGSDSSNTTNNNGEKSCDDDDLGRDHVLFSFPWIVADIIAKSLYIADENL